MWLKGHVRPNNKLRIELSLNEKFTDLTRRLTFSVSFQPLESKSARSEGQQSSNL